MLDNPYKNGYNEATVESVPRESIKTENHWNRGVFMQQETILKGFSLPDFPASFERATVEGEVEMIYAVGTDEATFRAYLDTLMAQGFALYVEDRLADNI